MKRPPLQRTKAAVLKANSEDGIPLDSCANN